MTTLKSSFHQCPLLPAVPGLPWLSTAFSLHCRQNTKQLSTVTQRALAPPQVITVSCHQDAACSGVRRLLGLPQPPDGQLQGGGESGGGDHLGVSCPVQADW